MVGKEQVMDSDYDSTQDTLDHIATVQEKALAVSLYIETYIVILHDMLAEFKARAILHDQSKLSPEEKRYFDKYTPLLKNCTYGSELYWEYLAALKPALDHHYGANAHHPEHHLSGINDMTLIDLLEMFADWKAATMRHDDGDLDKSITINQGRFGMDEQLTQILRNTQEAMEW